jgi:wyosine [tRNA(Phe)-imidazoG37] synthetase (radical SAM superfamily)
MNRKYKHIYGPVPSRRIGLSLGVDIIKSKYCTYDCVYCQLKKTDYLTIERRSFYPMEKILDEIKAKLSEDEPKPDFITFSGSGEPTLSSDIGALIRGIKSFTDISVAVLTNGSLLWMPEVREDIMAADLVVPSMDAIINPDFQNVNRPHADLEIGKIRRGLLDFGREFKGKIWLEILLVKNVNDSRANIDELLAFTKELALDRIQLNTVVRPPTEKDAEAVPFERLAEIAESFGPYAEVAVKYIPKKNREKTLKAQKESILDMLQRRPCSVKDIQESLAYHEQEIMKAIKALEEEGKIVSRTVSGVIFYEQAGK